MDDRRDADIRLLLNLVAEAHPHMVAYKGCDWDWVVRADAALALTPRPRTGPPAPPPSATATPGRGCTSA